MVTAMHQVPDSSPAWPVRVCSAFLDISFFLNLFSFSFFPFLKSLLDPSMPLILSIPAGGGAPLSCLDSLPKRKKRGRKSVWMQLSIVYSVVQGAGNFGG